MKSTFAKWMLFVSILGLSVLTTSCNKKKPVDPAPSTPKGALELYINPVAGITDLAFGTEYTNAAGNKYKVNQFKFFVSEVIFVRADGSEYKDDGIYLADMSNFKVLGKTAHGGKGALISVDNVPAGSYKGIRFTIGIPTDKNNIDATKITDVNNPLHTNNGMFWSWNSGYIFNRMEGTYDSLGSTKSFVIHIGNSSTENRRMYINFLSMTTDTYAFTIPENSHTVLQFSYDVNGVFKNIDGSNYDLNVVSQRNAQGGVNATTLSKNIAKSILKN